MSFSKKIIQLLAKPLLLCIGLTLAACGGGGGGSSSSSASGVVTYAGNTNQATIDSATAEDIANSYFNASNNNVGGVVAGASISSSQTLNTDSKNTLIKKLKQDALASIKLDNSLAAGVTGSAINAGDCSVNGITVGDGSSATSTTSVTNSEVTASITYTNLCIYDKNIDGVYLILNGVVSSSIIGTNLLDQNTPGSAVINQILFSAENLSVKYTGTTGASFTVTISEKYAFLFSYDSAGNLTKVNFTSSSDFGVNGTVYRFEIVVVDNVGGTTTIKLKFYHPVHGWVGYVSTLIFGCTDGSADGGSLVITGKNTSFTITPSGGCDGNFTIVENI